MNITMKIEGMNCGHCTAAVEEALLGVPGVTWAEADLATKAATIEAGDSVDRKALAAAVDDVGFEVVGFE
jgi:Cu2+-exporting ATPase/Cu+-exporting ATPase